MIYLILATTLVTNPPLVVQTIKPDGTTWTSFVMDAGSCLRGPLKFIDADGKVLFELTKDVEYPTGCGKKDGN